MQQWFAPETASVSTQTDQERRTTGVQVQPTVSDQSTEVTVQTNSAGMQARVTAKSILSQTTEDIQPKPIYG